MDRIGIREARPVLGDLVKQARIAGKATTLTEHGKDAARITPLADPRDTNTVVRRFIKAGVGDGSWGPEGPFAEYAEIEMRTYRDGDLEVEVRQWVDSSCTDRYMAAATAADTTHAQARERAEMAAQRLLDEGFSEMGDADALSL